MSSFTRAIVLSDSHGFYDTMIEMFTSEGLTDAEGRWVAPEDVQLIHLGDTVDRGPDSPKVFNFFRDLQRELGPERVVRLVGNHEFHYCGGPRFQQSSADEAVVGPLAPLMVEDGKAGLLKFGHALPVAGTDWLLVHGGLDPRLEGRIVPDLLTDFTPAEVARLLNEVGVDFFTPDLSDDRPEDHPTIWRTREALLTGVSRVRGGYDRISGVTWCDIVAELIPQAADFKFGQIVGHRASDEVYFHPDGKLIGVDVYYGLAQFLDVNLLTGEMSTSAIYGEEWNGR